MIIPFLLEKYLNQNIPVVLQKKKNADALLLSFYLYILLFIPVKLNNQPNAGSFFKEGEKLEKEKKPNKLYQWESESLRAMSSWCSLSFKTLRGKFTGN